MPGGRSHSAASWTAVLQRERQLQLPAVLSPKRSRCLGASQRQQHRSSASAALLGKLHSLLGGVPEWAYSQTPCISFQGGVGERTATSVLGLEGLHQIIAVAQLVASLAVLAASSRMHNLAEMLHTATRRALAE
jgi:hypothetical protein